MSVEEKQQLSRGCSTAPDAAGTARQNDLQDILASHAAADTSGSSDQCDPNMRHAPVETFGLRYDSLFVIHHSSYRGRRKWQTD
jgi:hypothetical protein